MGNIVLLDDLTINQIAAGEVIERPASVVKELVENSIDAGAKNINIDIRNGGISLIRITDDGCGIAKDDLELAFERHATSKIRSSNDLDEVSTFGFRGEALASVAAIACIEMISKRKEDEIGNKIVIKGGTLLEKEETGTKNGTRITITDLFYNTPVRYKFLKKDYTEAGYIEDAVRKIALVNPDISITLSNNGKKIIQTPGNGSSEALIYSLYGKDVANSTLELKYEYEDIKIKGFVGNSNIAKSNRSNQLFFINGRAIKDKTISSAVDQAFRKALPAGKFAFVILEIEMNPKEVDVNVHPAKLEVRFQNDEKIFKAVYSALKQVIQNMEFNPDEMTSSISNRGPKAELDSEENVYDTADIGVMVKESIHNAISEDDVKNEVQEDVAQKDVTEEKELNEEEKAMKSREEEFEARLQAFMKKKEIPKDDKYETMSQKFDQTFEETSKTATGIGNFFKKFKKNNNEEKEINEEQEAATNNIKEIYEMRANQDDGIEIDDVDMGATPFSQKVAMIEKEEKEENNFENMEDESTQSIVQAEETVRVTPVSMEEDPIEESTSKVSILDNEDNDNDVIQESSADYNKEEKIIPESLTDKLLQQKLSNSFQDTQFINVTGTKRKSNNEGLTKEFAEMYKKTFGVEVVSERQEKEEEKKTTDATSVVEIPDNIKISGFDSDRINYKYVGECFYTYAIIEIKDEMYIIDVKAAKERLTFEMVKENYYLNQMNSQELLLPDVISLSSKSAFNADKNKLLLSKAGFEFEEFGEDTVKLTAVPAICEPLNTKQLFSEILSNLEKVAINDTTEKELNIVSSIAKKIVEEEKLSFDEKDIDAILQQLLQLDNPFSYNYGQQAAIKMTRGDLERKFSRR